MFRFAKKRLLSFAVASVVFSFLLGSSSVYAHDFWVNASAPEKDLVKAEIGYGHDFPNPEPIAEGRVHLFDSLQLIKPDGVLKLKQVGENYAYQEKEALKKGSYIVTGTYLPTFWSKGSDGWAQKSRAQRPDATYCEKVTMFAKAVLNVSGSTSDEFVTKPIGQELEIVPLVNPAKVKTGEKFPVQILFDGKPLRTAKVSATFGGFSDRGYKAFSGRTDLEGYIDIIPLKAGYWYAEVEHKYGYEDKNVCDEVVLISTLTFNIND
ncbi:DUF4198 domain-containing protein [Aminobacterium mobile]|uniref:DUF4198 domain-containing protein n=1 Tax=Aminobacterium mobile TaxID=81467 RepID=UPI0004AFC2F9|nr:DUF4198 domain-containing protein [Aminobacterium mobile]